MQVGPSYISDFALIHPPSTQSDFSNLLLEYTSESPTRGELSQMGFVKYT